MSKLKIKLFFKQLKVQIASYYLVVSMVVILLMSSIYYYSATSIIKDDTLEQTIYAVEQSAEDISGYLLELKHTGMYLSQHPDIIDYLMAHSELSKEKSLSVINQTLATNTSIESIVAVGKSGNVVSNESQLDMSVSDDMMKETWYVNAIDNQQMPVLTSARLQSFSMDKTTWVIAISQEIIDSYGENIGVILIDIKYQVIENYLDHLPLGEQGFAFIIDEQSNLVYHPDPVYFTEESKQNELLEMFENQEGYDVEEQLLTHHNEIPNTHWTLVGVSSLERLDTVKRQLTEVLLLLSGVLLFVVLGGSYIFAERITKPIKKLQMAMANFEDIKGSIEIEGCFEVEQLNDQFNKMLDEINRLLKEIKENQAYLRNYEINALYSQINPHFLYNTLDTIVWMAEFNDSEKVIEVTKSLAQFFRISLSKGQEMIRLEEEVEHIKQYLFIQKQRYVEQLDYKIELEPSLKEVLVPKIILQPFVENALYHGIREKDAGGMITVTCKKRDENILITIHDDGVGYNKEKTTTVKLGGVGIENVRKRLSLVYGEKCELVITSELNKGTTVTIKLPLKSST